MSGTAIYVFFIVPNYVQDATTTVNTTFSIDGQPAGTYLHEPSTDTVYAYNVPVFSQGGLENTKHSLLITPTGGPKENSLLLFDYAVYTYVYALGIIERDSLPA
jgi:hypothetical protein